MSEESPAGETPPQARAAAALPTPERLIVRVLIALALVVITLTTLDLGWLLLKDLLTPPVLLLDIDELLEVLGFFLLILIGLELLLTIRAYAEGHARHGEIVLEVALIAIARKVIITKVSDYDAPTLLAIAGLVLALAIAYYLVRASGRQRS